MERCKVAPDRFDKLNANGPKHRSQQNPYSNEVPVRPEPVEGILERCEAVPDRFDKLNANGPKHRSQQNHNGDEVPVRPEPVEGFSPAGVMRVHRPQWGLALFLAISVLPIAASLGYAALYSVGLTGLLAQGFTLEHWSSMLNATELWGSLGISLWIASAVVLVSTALGLAIALGLGPAVDRGLLGWSMHVPLAFPGTVAALSVFMLFGATGWIPRLLLQLGIVSQLEGGWSLVQDPLGVGVIVAHAFAATALFTLSFRALHGSERLDALDRIAASLGANSRQRLWRVAIPLLLRRGTPTLALVFILILGSYEIPKLLGRQSPQMLSVLVMRKYARFDITEKPAALVVALVYTALVAAVVAWLAWQHTRRSKVQS